MKATSNNKEKPITKATIKKTNKQVYLKQITISKYF